jgi:hypothetical protein
MANPAYVANNIPTALPAEPILGTDDLKTYTPLAGLGALALAAGVPTGLTNWGGDLYYDGTTVISTNFTNPAMIAAWDGSWAIPFVSGPTDFNTFVGGGGNNRQPQSGSQAIDFDGTTYAIGAYDENGNTSVYISTSPKTAWTLVNLNTDASFDAVQGLKWIPRLNLWVAVGDDIWTSPSGAAVWTVRESSDHFYQQIYDDGTTLWAIGTTKVWKSTNGTTWTGTIQGANYPWSSTNNRSPLWFSSRLNLWIGIAAKGGSSPDPNYGIVYATAPDQAWQYGYTSPNNPPSVPADEFDQIAEIGGTLYVTGRRVTSISPVSTEAVIAASVFGTSSWALTISTLPEVPSFAFSSFSGIVGAPDNTSLGLGLKNANALDEFTNVFSTDGGATLTNEYLGGQFHQIIGITVIPPKPTACVDFEIQSPGDMPDSGAQFTGQRLYIAVDCWKSRPLGSPEKLTPTIIVDGVETILPQITNTERSTIELPISQHHGRFFDGVRLDGCLLTSRVEIYGIWADVWLGEQSESS